MTNINNRPLNIRALSENSTHCFVQSHPLQGVQVHVFYPNGYGASIVRLPGSIGNEAGLWELAVLEGDPDSSRLAYDTPITDNVLGWLSEEDVLDACRRISAL